MNLAKIVGGMVLMAESSGCLYTCGKIDVIQKEIKSPLLDFDGDGKLDVFSCKPNQEKDENGAIITTKYEVFWQRNLGEGQLAEPQRLYFAKRCPFY